MKTLGTAASAIPHRVRDRRHLRREDLLTVKLASAHFYDSLPTTGDETGRAFRMWNWKEVLAGHKIGLGAVRRKYFA